MVGETKFDMEKFLIAYELVKENRINITDACNMLRISRYTYKRAVEKLKGVGAINEKSN